jgi:tRNA-specific 2-thiouridylase
MKSKILLAVSGGVDSSVAIAILQESYEVVGVTFRFFDDFDSADAKAVSERFNIEHRVIDRRGDFVSRVITPFCESWLSGETPNPCAFCNRVMKFPALFDAADEAGIRLVATGHYARAENSFLKQALTETGEINPKDQSYMLYGLNAAQLSRIIFPLGELSKARVRKIAAEQGLINAARPDSQDICFIPNGDYAGFITEFTGICSQPGDFMNKQGEIIGRHKGLIHYTSGQRRGLDLSSHERLYVISRCAKSNTVTIGEKSEIGAESFTVKDVVWHTEPPIHSEVKVRYGHTKYPCVIEHGESITVNCQPSTVNCTPGQCAVFYNGDTVIGGGIIC